MIGVPLLVASFVMPALTSQVVAGAVPAEIPLDATDIADAAAKVLDIKTSSGPVDDIDDMEQSAKDAGLL